MKEEINDKEINIFINKYLGELPEKWHTKLDFYLAMKNAMLEALSYPEKYTVRIAMNESIVNT